MTKRVFTIAALAFLSLSACAGGAGLLTEAGAPPLSLLRGSPFSSYLIPGLSLIVFVGGSSATAVILLIRRHRAARTVGLLASGAIIVFELVEVVVVGFPAGFGRNLQIFYFALGVILAFLLWPLETQRD
jgi:hypothetical protein